jgi:hypothetical protein
VSAVRMANMRRYKDFAMYKVIVVAPFPPNTPQHTRGPVHHHREPDSGTVRPQALLYEQIKNRGSTSTTYATHAKCLTSLLSSICHPL